MGQRTDKFKQLLYKAHKEWQKLRQELFLELEEFAKEEYDELKNAASEEFTELKDEFTHTEADPHSYPAYEDPNAPQTEIQ